MGELSHALSCYVPYATALVTASAAYLISGGGSVLRFIASSLTGWIGATGALVAITSFNIRGETILGNCSPIAIGASILGAIIGISGFYELRRHLGGGRPSVR